LLRTYPTVTYILLQVMVFCCLMDVSITETFLFFYEKHYRKDISCLFMAIYHWTRVTNKGTRLLFTLIDLFNLIHHIQCGLAELICHNVKRLNRNTDYRKFSQYMNELLCGRKLNNIFCRIRYALQLAIPCDGICQR